MSHLLIRQRQTRFYSSYAPIAIVLILTLLSVSCTKKEQPTVKPTPEIQMMENEPEFRIGHFMVLKEISRGPILPYVSSGDGSIEDLGCFIPTNKLEPWQTTNVDILEMMASNRSAIHEAVANWLIKTFDEVEGEPLSKGFKMKLKKPMILHVPESKTRLAEDQTCISIANNIVDLPTQVVTTMFGSRIIEVTSSVPIPPETIKAMRQTAKVTGIKLQATPAEYPRAKDEANNPIKDEKGRPLFVAPDGSHVLRAKIPKPKNRPVIEWKLKLSDPLYFAAGDLPTDVWETETIKEQCDIYLVFDDAIPRFFDCGKPKDAGFGVTKGDDQSHVIVKVTVDGQTSSKPVRFNKRTPIISGGRVVAWVTSKKVVEGARLFVDSVVLFQDTAGNEGGSSPKPTVARPAPPAPKPSNKPKKPKKDKDPKPAKIEEKKEESPPPPIPVY